MTSSLRPLRLIAFGGSPVITVAQARGLLAAEGVEVETTVTPSSTEQMRGLSQSTWDLASTAFDNVLAWSGREGAEIVAVAQAGGAALLPVYVRPEIKDWEDLRGRKVAVDAVDTAFGLVLRRILLEHGLDAHRGDYELVPAGATGYRFESMQRGECFAAILNAPWSGKAEEAGMVRFADHRDVVPDYPGGVYGVTRTWAADHADELTGYLRALHKALRWIHDSATQDEAAALVAEGEGSTAEEAAAGLRRLPPDLALNMPGLAVSLGLRVELGLIPPMGPRLERYVDGSFYEAATAP